LQDAPDKIVKYIVHQFAKVLPHHPQARKSFVQSKGLQRIQQLRSQEEEGTKLNEFIATINGCYPREIIEYYSPNYSETLLSKLDEYSSSSAVAATGNPVTQAQ